MNTLNQELSNVPTESAKLNMALDGVDPIVQMALQQQNLNSTPSVMSNPLGAVAPTTSPVPSAPSSVVSGSSWGDFVNAAKGAAKSSGFPLSVILGQAALESARGKAAPGNNYFGMKGMGNAGANNLATQEFGPNGYYGENSNFAAFKTPGDSINAYLKLVENYPGVRQALTTGDPDTILRTIEKAGYATSPTYVRDVESTPEFQQYK